MVFGVEFRHAWNGNEASSCRNMLVARVIAEIQCTNAPIIDAVYYVLHLIITSHYWWPHAKHIRQGIARRNDVRGKVCSANNFHAQRHDFFTVCVLGLCALHNISWINCAPAPNDGDDDDDTVVAHVFATREQNGRHGEKTYFPTLVWEWEWKRECVPHHTSSVWSLGSCATIKRLDHT